MDTDSGVPIETDPVRALMGAERDGLLTYRGYTSGDRYEVEIAGATRVVPLADVMPTVERLRAVARLAADGVDARLVLLAEDGTHGLEVDGNRWQIPADQVLEWCAGYTAAMRGQGEEHVGPDHLGKIRDVLRNPSISDQCRVVILGLMYGRDVETTMDELAVKVGRSKKTVIEALTFGKGLAPDLADLMIAAFGLRWSVRADDREMICERSDGGEPAGQLPQMPGVARLCRIVAAADQGWVRYEDEPSPNRARWARRYELAVGQRSYTVPAAGLEPWLDGVRAFHASRAQAAEEAR